MREIKFRQLIDGHFNYWVVRHENDYHQSQQFTGLKDKNGKEIYEGDIMALSSIVKDFIIFREGQFTPEKAMPHEAEAFMTSGEVIGNIYENPELLKSKA